MIIQEFTDMARNLMDEHGCAKLGIRFEETLEVMASCEANGYPSLSGKTYWIPAEMIFSFPWMIVLDEDDCRNIVLHEIAHAHTFNSCTPDDQHGLAFKEKCRELGTPALDECYTPKTPVEKQEANLKVALRAWDGVV